MRLLLDTHILIWAATDNIKLPKAAAQLIDDQANTSYFGAASLWELTIKGDECTGKFRRRAQCPLAKAEHGSCRRRLAGDEALEPCGIYPYAIAGKPAPTSCVVFSHTIYRPCHF